MTCPRYFGYVSPWVTNPYLYPCSGFKTKGQRVLQTSLLEVIDVLVDHYFFQYSDCQRVTSFSHVPSSSGSPFQCTRKPILRFFLLCPIIIWSRIFSTNLSNCFQIIDSVRLVYCLEISNSSLLNFFQKANVKYRMNFQPVKQHEIVCCIVNSLHDPKKSIKLRNQSTINSFTTNLLPHMRS